MPSICTENYIVRFTSTLHDDESSPANYPNHWPALVPLNSTYSDMHRCPNDMHMVLWGASLPVEVQVNSNDSLPPSDLTLHEDEMLFVPRSMSIALRLVSESAWGGVLRNCFVDASNIRQFVGALSIEAKRSPASQALLDAISSVDYKAAQTSFFMELNPQDLSLLEYFSHRREKKLSRTTDWQRRKVSFKGGFHCLTVAI